MFKFAKKHIDATVPRRNNAYDAGMDISSREDVVIGPGEKYAVATGVALLFPNDCYARIAPRSGLAFKHTIDVLAGVVDYGYTDEIRVILVNHGKTDFVVKSGDRIAQIIFEKIYVPDVVEEISYDELCVTISDNKRGLNGFGSSGV
jgi:dUTP pyrophosphatase